MGGRDMKIFEVINEEQFTKDVEQLLQAYGLDCCFLFVMQGGAVNGSIIWEGTNPAPWQMKVLQNVGEAAFDAAVSADSLEAFRKEVGE